MSRRTELAAALQLASLYARVFLKTGAIFDVTPAGLRELGRQAIKRTSRGPSSMYRANAENSPRKEAVVCDTTRLDYGTLNARVDRLASALRDHHGMRRGDSAVVLMRNRSEFLEAQAAMSRLGGGAVSASWRSTPDELEYLVNHCGARAVFVETEVADALLAASPRFDSVPAGNLIGVGRPRPPLVRYEDLLAKGQPGMEEPAETGAVVIYTSGTTGKPKGAVRKFPREMARAVLHFLGDSPLRSDDRHLAVCPMYHSTAFAFISFTMALGGTVVIDREFDPERFLALVERERITTAAVVPTMLHRVLQLPSHVRNRYDTRSLRVVFSGGAPLSGALARRFIEAFGHVLYNFYGATETGINTLATPDELLRSPGTIGHVVPGNEIRLLDEEGREVRTGEIGELYVRNAMLVAGYHRDDRATRESMRDGFFSVGDLAHVDEHGLFHIDGRKRDMIISGGVNVYPAEVEETLAKHPSVAEAAVIGVPDEEWGERVRAYVALRAGHEVGPQELVAFARKSLAGPKVPREVIVLPELPKNPTGKVLKRELRGL